MKKLFSAVIAISAAAVMLTGCSGKDDAGNNTETSSDQTTTSQSQTTTMSKSRSETAMTSKTGDVDGDGLIEELGTDVNDMVEDVVTGAEDIAGDILNGGDKTNGNNARRSNS